MTAVNSTQQQNAEWADVKKGVIDVEQRALDGEDVKTLLDELQTTIAGE